MAVAEVSTEVVALLRKLQGGDVKASSWQEHSHVLPAPEAPARCVNIDQTRRPGVTVLPENVLMMPLQALKQAESDPDLTRRTSLSIRTAGASTALTGPDQLAAAHLLVDVSALLQQEAHDAM